MAGTSDTTPSRRGSTPCSGTPTEATPKVPEHRSPNTAYHSAYEPSRPASFTPVTEALYGLGIGALQSQNATVTPINPGPRRVAAASHRLPRTRRSSSPNCHDGSAQPLRRSTANPYPNPHMKSMRVLDLESEVPANLPGNSQQKAAWPRFLALSLHRSTPTPPTPPRSEHHASSIDRHPLGEPPSSMGSNTTPGDLTRKPANRFEKRHGKDSYYWSSKDSERPRSLLGSQPPSLPPESQMCLDSDSHAQLGQTDNSLAISSASLQHMHMGGVPPSHLLTPINTVAPQLPDSPKRKRRKAEMGSFDSGVIRSPSSDRFYWSSEEEESATYTHKSAYPSSTPSISTPSIPPRTPRRSPRTPPGPVARSSPVHPYTPPPRATPRRNSHIRTPERATFSRETRRSPIQRTRKGERNK